MNETKYADNASNTKTKKRIISLAARFRNINLILVALVISVFAVINYVIIVGFVREVSIDNVELLTMESVDILNAHLGKEIALVKDAAATPEIIEWFADPDNPEKKAAAYAKLTVFADLLQMKKVYFAIAQHSDTCGANGLNHTASGCLGLEYIVDAGAPYESFIPYDDDGDAVLRPENATDGWYFDILDSDFDLILKLDTSNTFDDYQIFIDIKVQKDDLIVGTFSAALEFNEIYNELFGGYDNDITLGLIIDNKGIIQLDSSKPDALSLIGESSVYNADEMFHIRSFRTDDEFLGIIDRYLNDVTFFSGKRVYPDIIRLSEGEYEYMSIAPIPNTNWLKITFYSSTALFNIRRLIPLVVIVFAAFVCYVAIAGIVMQRIVFYPLKSLTSSVASSEHNSDRIYGLKREDEIGELARALRSAWKRLSENNMRLLFSVTERERQAKALHTLNAIATSLFGAEDEAAFTQTLPEGLCVLAQSMDLARICVWRNDGADEDLCMTLLCDRMNNESKAGSLIKEGQRFSYAKDAPELLNTLKNGKYIYHTKNEIPASNFSNTLSDTLKRVLLVPIVLSGDFWGFVQFDDNDDNHVLTIDDIEILHSGCLIIGSAINRNAQTSELRSSNARANEMLAQIERRDMLLQSINQAASVLLASDVTEFDKTLYKGMRMMTKAVEADRVYIWRNSVIDGRPYTSQIYEWVGESAPETDNEYTSNISYYDNLPDWYEKLKNGECVNGMSKDMAPETRAFMEVSHVKSAFAVPIFVRDEFWGFTGFDDCTQERVFSDIEEAILRSGCLMIGNAFLRHEMTMDLQNSIARLKALQEELEEALKEAEAASLSKSAFLANMSHEIRTPMNSIIGFAELALDDSLPQKTREYLSKILTNSEWLLQIINDVLDISKIESGKMEMECIPFDLHEMFVACRASVLPKVIEKGLTMHFYAEPSVGKRIYGDPTRLRQVFLNLLSNAVKFTNTGMIKMLASINDAGDDYIEMYFEVKDSGIGIPAEKLESIFDPFTQADTGTTRKYGGSGLGLPITKRIIEMMGGTLNVESVPGIGTKFFFTLRFLAKDDESRNEPEALTVYDNIEKPQFSGEVLLCEDNLMNQQVICEHLARVGLKTIVAQNGRIGVDLIKQRLADGTKQFDLVLMDIHMPVMDGIEAAEHILSMGTDVPIVAMTANIMKNDRELYIAQGMRDCIGKPFTSQELWRCLLKYFSDAPKAKTSEDVFEANLRRDLIKLFIEDHSNTFGVLKNALDKGDLTLAYRTVHNLKTNAAQLQLNYLIKAAAEIDAMLKKGDGNIPSALMQTLELELRAALHDLKQTDIDAD